MVHVRLYAGLRDLARRGDLEIPWTSGLTVASVREFVTRQHPATAPLLERSKVAVGDQLAEDETAVPDGGEVSFLPPVSGG